MESEIDEKFAPFEKRIGYRFRNRTLLQAALTHKSRANEVPGQTDNQRLEFFGDAILDFLISNTLFDCFPTAREGELTQMRAALVDESGLAGIAESLDIGSWLSLGRGEEKSGGRRKRSLLADAYEALLAAVFLDGGISAARRVVKKHFERQIAQLQLSGTASTDFKTELQELTQSRFATTPVYELTATEGPDHDRVYTVTVMVAGAVAGAGRGKSKKEAQQAAAQKALVQLNS